MSPIKKCPKGKHKSKSGKKCIKNKPKRYKLNFSLIYGKKK
ncbi:MAG: hypothetical protein ABIH37_01830 [archaeon]